MTKDAPKEALRPAKAVKKPAPDSTVEPTAKEIRLAAALRENLRRRKAAQRKEPR